MYVIGFMSSDGVLGRTFKCNTLESAERSITKLTEEIGDTPPPVEYWDDSCAWHTERGVYFIGELETTDWENDDA